MIKVHISTCCPHCDGQAYLEVGEAESNTGERYTRFRQCDLCQGTGETAKWVSLDEFLKMLEDLATRDPMAPDYLELARKLPTSQYQDSRDAAGI